jgi:hypothetical protein
MWLGFVAARRPHTRDNLCLLLLSWVAVFRDLRRDSSRDSCRFLPRKSFRRIIKSRNWFMRMLFKVSLEFAHHLPHFFLQGSIVCASSENPTIPPSMTFGRTLAYVRQRGDNDGHAIRCRVSLRSVDKHKRLGRRKIANLHVSHASSMAYRQHLANRVGALVCLTGSSVR